MTAFQTAEAKRYYSFNTFTDLHETWYAQHATCTHLNGNTNITVIQI
jgi:hypothetical protein